MPVLHNIATGRDEFVPNDALERALASGEFVAPEGVKQAVVTPAGRVVDAPVAALEASSGLTGATPATEARRAQEERGAYVEQEHGGALSGIGATVEGVLEGATLGGYGAATRAFLPDSYTDARRGRAEAHPIKSGLAEVGGAIAPAFFTAGAGAAGTVARALPSGMAARAGGAVTARLGGGVLATGAGLAVEGAAQGFGQGVSELSISADPVSVERAASVLLSSTATGGAGGFGIGVFAKAAQKGLVRGKAVLDDAKAASAKAAEAPDDLASLDRPGLRAAKDAEGVRLKDAQVQAKAAAGDELATYRAALEDANPWLVTDGQPKAVLTQTKRSMRRLLDEPIGLRENPARALDPLRREAEAVKRALGESAETSAKLAKEEAKLAGDLALELGTLPDVADAVVLEGKLARRYGEFTGAKVGKAGAKVTREEAAEFHRALAAGEVQGARQAALGKLQGVLDQNLALQGKIKASLEAPTSPRMAQIEAAADALAAGKPKGVLEQMVSGSAYGTIIGALPAIPVVGPVLAPLVAAKGSAKFTDLVFGRLGKASAESAARSTAAVSAFLDTSVRVAPRAAAASVPIASRTLASTSFGPPTRDPRPDTVARKEPDLVASFRARERELRQQVLPGTDGRLQATPAARQRVADSLAAMRALDPVLADQIETIAARRIEFLASKLPYRPDFLATQVGPETWRPTDMQIRSFARYVAAVEDPGGVEERLAAGIVTPEDAEAYRVVYPERFAALKRDIVSKLPELRESLPYARQIALSIFTGIAVDPAMRPEVLARLQGNYRGEQGSEGGQMAPRAAPKFGSVAVKNMEPGTPAQQRADRT